MAASTLILPKWAPLQVCAHPAVAHALKVRQALVFARFPHFFKLYATAPNLGRALMDMCFSRVRFAALETVVDAFKATKVKVLYVASVLGFLVKPEGEGALPAVVSEDTAVDLDLHSSDGGLMLPGCAKTIHLGKHPAQVSTDLQTLCHVWFCYFSAGSCRLLYILFVHVVYLALQAELTLNLSCTSCGYCLAR